MTISDLIDYLQQLPGQTVVVLDDEAAQSVDPGVPFITLAYVLDEWPSQPQVEEPWPGD